MPAGIALDHSHSHSHCAIAISILLAKCSLYSFPRKSASFQLPAPAWLTNGNPPPLLPSKHHHQDKRPDRCTGRTASHHGGWHPPVSAEPNIALCLHQPPSKKVPILSAPDINPPLNRPRATAPSLVQQTLSQRCRLGRTPTPTPTAVDLLNKRSILLLLLLERGARVTRSKCDTPPAPRGFRQRKAAVVEKMRRLYLFGGRLDIGAGSGGV